MTDVHSHRDIPHVHFDIHTGRPMGSQDHTDLDTGHNDTDQEQS